MRIHTPRTRIRLACAAALAPLMAAGMAGAEEEELTLGGTLEFGGRSVSGDARGARFLEYRDLGDGLIGDFDLSAERGLDHLRARSENAGWDDQRYWLEGGRRGAFGIDLFYGELPHLFSTRASSPFIRMGGDEFLLPAGAQSTIAATPAAGRPAALTALLQGSEPVPLELRWIEGRTGFHAEVAEGVRIESGYRIQDRRGARNFAANFGSPGGSFVSVAGSLDDRIHEVRAAADVTSDRGSSLRMEYLGSFYENDLESLTIANPLVATDTATAASAARSSVDPDNSAHQLSLVGAADLPLGFPARASGSLAYGIRLQDDRFLPHTRNSDPAFASPGLALPRSRLEGEVHTWAATLALFARPVPRLHVDLRTRLYDYDNRTDSVLLPAHVVNDGALVSSARRAVFSDYRTHEAELEVGYDPFDSLRTTLAYDWQYWKRSRDRNVEHLHEHGPALKLRWRPIRRTEVRMEYAFHTRRGSDYDPFAFFESVEGGALDPVAASILEFSRLRRPDQANRDAHDARLVTALQPHTDVAWRAEASLRSEDYPDSDYGLRERKTWSIGTDASWQLHPRVLLAGFYTFEKSIWTQRSRWRPRNFTPAPATTVIDDPVNDWTSRTRDRFHNIGATLDLALLPQRLDARLGYLLQLGRQKQRATTPPGSVGIGFFANGDDAARWPDIEDRLQSVTAELDFHWSEAVTFSGGYRFEKIDVDDFRNAALGPAPIAGDSTLDVYLGDTRGDAQAHVVTLKAQLRF